MIDTNYIRSLNDSLNLTGYKNLTRLLCKELDAARDEIDRLRAGKPKPQGKMVRVKVAVAVDKTGDWNAIGGFGQDEKESMKDAMTDLEYGESHYWLTADLSIPEETTVEGEVHTATTDENATGGRGRTMMTINCPICGFEPPGHALNCPNRAGNKVCPLCGWANGHHKPECPQLNRDYTGRKPDGWDSVTTGWGKK